MADANALLHQQEEAELGRRANAALRADLKDQTRIYDPTKERTWEHKYHFFSGKHMKGTFRVYARARHDPFNKDPSWGRFVLANVNEHIQQSGKDIQDIFNGVDIKGDGNLTRPELKKALTKAMPHLSDQECTVIFDSIDEDRSGSVGVAEFTAALEAGKQGDAQEHKDLQDRAGRWRNPLHRMKRFPPACVEGYDHIDHATSPGGYSLDKLYQAEAEKVISRLGEHLLRTPRTLQHPNHGSKYDTFTGGADATRFRRAAYQKDLSEGSTRPSTGATPRQPRGATPRPTTGSQRPPTGTPRKPSCPPAFELRDPGGANDIRPGFLCDPQSRGALSARGFSAFTPRGHTNRRGVRDSNV